jgi:hypothetical protein
MTSYSFCSANKGRERVARSASREGKAQGHENVVQAARAKPKHTSCPNQAAPGCPDR